MNAGFTQFDVVLRWVGFRCFDLTVARSCEFGCSLACFEFSSCCYVFGTACYFGF